MCAVGTCASLILNDILINKLMGPEKKNNGDNEQNNKNTTTNDKTASGS